MDNKHLQFISGPIPSETALSLFSNNSGAGARACFFGTIRPDVHDGQTVSGIEYTMHAAMAEAEIEKICREVIREFGVYSAKVIHSVGHVPAGQVSLLVVIESQRRATCFKALEECVNEVKSRAPIWGREIFAGGAQQWKTNK